MKQEGYYPSLEEFQKFSTRGNLIPVYRELMADLETPVSIYARAFQGPSCLLESVEGSEKLARYSFIAGEPFMLLQADGERVEVEEKGFKRTITGSPLAVLRELLSRYQAVEIPGLPRFPGGAVGYIGYDVVRSWERLFAAPPDDLELPDMLMIFPGVVIVFDHYTSRIKIISCAHVDKNPEKAYRDAVDRIEKTMMRLQNDSFSQAQPELESWKPDPGFAGDLELKSSMSRDDFENKVKTIKDYIYAGDALQVVLSQRFEVKAKVSSFAVYRALRSLNPSPYMYYLDFGEVRIAGTSPELLVSLEDGVLETRPIAGTRPRGKTPQEDQALEKELLADAKERAEHVMLVDLGRNDLGKISRYGSVKVPTFMACERYSHVMHLVSAVKGIIQEGRDAVDALIACFPAGTVSGAPKVRAMEIIDELEPSRRGPYAGAVGYFSFWGNMDTCITIRTIIFKNGRAYAQAGAGIVADSDPRREYEETVFKARALLQAQRIAEGS